jgi:hypothetical protein
MTPDSVSIPLQILRHLRDELYDADKLLGIVAVDGPDEIVEVEIISNRICSAIRLLEAVAEIKHRQEEEE